METELINLATQAITNATMLEPLKIQLVSTTNWSQLVLSLAVSSVFLLWIFGTSISLSLKTFFTKLQLSIIKRYTGRHVLLIKHTQSGFFSQSMIDQDTMKEVNQAFLKFDGKPFDLIIHTPGGDIFNSLLISKMLKRYPAKIRAVIPLYSMSGGSLLALSCNELYLGNNAVIGPIDPQIGSLFKFGSAAAWDKVVKFKKTKAEDSSITMAMIGKQYEKTIHNHLMQTIDFGLDSNQKERLVKFLTDGKVEHGFQVGANELTQFGIKVKGISKYIQTKLLNILTSKSLEGVHYI